MNSINPPANIIPLLFITVIF